MHSLDALSLLVYSIAAINCFFMTLVYSFSGRGLKILNRLLAVIFLIAVLRLGKSVGIHFFEAFHDSAHAMWFGGLGYWAVILYLYVSQIPRLSPSRRIAGLHLIAPTVLFLLIALYRGRFSPTWPQFDIWTYRAAGFVFFLYLFLSFQRYRKIVRGSIRHSPASRWTGGLLLFFAGEGFLIGAYLIVPYYVPDVEAWYFSVAIYLFMFVEMKTKLVSRAHERTRTLPESDETLERMLVGAMENEKLYLSTSLTLPGLAKRIGTNANKLSRFINTRFNRNFNDFVNSYRIEEAMRSLRDPGSRSRTIAAIAMECGFNSISVFNHAFKKIAGKTPSQFQSES